MDDINFFSILKAVVAGIVAIGLTGGIFFAGYTVGIQSGDVIITGVSNQEAGQPKQVDFGVFWEAWKVVRQKYYQSENVSDQELVYGALSGLLRALDDPHSVFFNPSDTDRFEEDISGEFGGVGMEIGMREGRVTVISPLAGTPAEEAGLKAGDAILKVDDTFTTGLTLDEAVELIRGPRGTDVVLLIERESFEEPKEFSITRDRITIPALDAEVLEEGDKKIVHIQLYNFNSNVPMVFYEASVEYLWQKPDGVVLDLRNNPGGFLDVSVQLAGWFLEKGSVITKEQFRTGESNVFRASGNEALNYLPVVVLVNEGSASASEILAGALRDHRDAPLVGQKTFGKGSVQEVQPLSDGSSMKITVAEWVTPDGHKINDVGLEPDYEVEITEEDIEEGVDPQLDKAIEVLLQEIEQ